MNKEELKIHQLVVLTTSRCNLDCHHCPYSVTNKKINEIDENEITEESIEFMLAQLDTNFNRKFSSVLIHGPGEPLLKWKEISYLLKRANSQENKSLEKDVNFIVMTNSLFLANENIFKELSQYKNLQFALNFVGCSKAQIEKAPLSELF